MEDDQQRRRRHGQPGHLQGRVTPRGRQSGSPLRLGQVEPDRHGDLARAVVDDRRERRHERAVLVGVGPEHDRACRGEQFGHARIGLLVDRAWTRGERAATFDALGTEHEVSVALGDAVDGLLAEVGAIRRHLARDALVLGQQLVVGGERQRRKALGADRSRDRDGRRQQFIARVVVGRAGTQFDQRAGEAGEHGHQRRLHAPPDRSSSHGAAALPAPSR